MKGEAGRVGEIHQHRVAAERHSLDGWVKEVTEMAQRLSRQAEGGKVDRFLGIRTAHRREEI
ncbi:MAG: hypothetical protein P8Z67_02060, partial [Gammaproteobacteria bacterium]